MDKPTVMHLDNCKGNQEGENVCLESNGACLYHLKWANPLIQQCLLLTSFVEKTCTCIRGGVAQDARCQMFVKES